MKGWTGIAGIVALAVVVAGCGGGGGSGKGGPKLPPGPKRASAGGQKLSQVNLPDSATELAALLQQQIGTSQTVRITATTAAEGNNGKSSVEMTGALLRPAGQQASATLKVVEVGGKEAGTTHVMVGNGSVYTKVEGEPYAFGKPWLQVSNEELSSASVDATVKESYRSALNLAQQAVQQSGGDLGVTVLTHGKLLDNPEWEKLAGTDVRRYSGATDTRTLAGATRDPRLQQMAAGGFLKYPWTVWVDRFGLPRQFVSTISIPNAGTITSKATYQAWGQPITISFPLPTEVASIRN